MRKNSITRFDSENIAYVDFDTDTKEGVAGVIDEVNGQTYPFSGGGSSIPVIIDSQEAVITEDSTPVLTVRDDIEDYAFMVLSIHDEIIFQGWPPVVLTKAGQSFQGQDDTFEYIVEYDGDLEGWTFYFYDLNDTSTLIPGTFDIIGLGFN